jgi:hypothetical protein
MIQYIVSSTHIYYSIQYISPDQSFVLQRQEGTECMAAMEVNNTNYRQPDALIPNHPAVRNFLQSKGRTMNYRAAFKNVKQAKSFCQEHFNGFDLQGVYHP